MNRLNDLVIVTHHVNKALSTLMGAGPSGPFEFPHSTEAAFEFSDRTGFAVLALLIAYGPKIENGSSAPGDHHDQAAAR